MNIMLKHIATMLHLPGSDPVAEELPGVPVTPGAGAVAGGVAGGVADPVAVPNPGEVLRSARLRQGVSIRGLAGSAGMSISSVVRAERTGADGIRTSMHVRLTGALERIAARAAEAATVRPASSPEQGRTRIRWSTPLPALDTGEASPAQRALKGTILRELRQARALTVAQVCSVLNITQGHLRMLEAGEVERHLPYDRAIVRVASTFPFEGKSR